MVTAAIRVAAAIIVACAASLPARANGPSTALAEAAEAYAKITDYRMTIAVHETAGDRSLDTTYRVLFMKPSIERVDILAGPDKGGGLVWLGGQTVKAHHGGWLSGLRITLNIHSRLIATLRGDTVDVTTVPAMLGHFSAIKGNLTEALGPPIDGADSTIVTLDVANPETNHGITREVLFLSAATHFPVRRESYIGSQLVKSISVETVDTDVGLTSSDFPW